MTIWEQQGGREVPVGSHVLLILSGAPTKRRTSCHSHDLLMSSPLQSQSSFLLIMRIRGFVGEPVDKPNSGGKLK